ncbi:exodeoxyribonuclease VII small subunit [Miniphocaeibacter massiliensis]|uniref:exodeoxyribonuclease VII small subunit n=1 Tax=Miniphocaeibacter massiliensis TaxID=2041841 RepID=UPI001A91961E|nr:exodeoxyribonuclease VII small subunit [Miniphocaeibacter massiliensis]
MSNDFKDYEKGINRLNEILEKMEEGDISLEENVLLYEEGIKLHNKLSKILEKEEGKIRLISEGESKEINEINFLDEEI